MFNMNDYREALEERDKYDMDSKEWRLAQTKVSSIIAVMVSSRNPMMVEELVDEVYSLYDCGANLEDESVQYDLWLLESNGYKEEAKELRELDWE
jgi:hypothetical protein